MRPRTGPIILAAFFFLGGVAALIFEPTREIGLGPTWVAVGGILLIVFLFSGSLKQKWGSLRQKAD